MTAVGTNVCGQYSLLIGRNVAMAAIRVDTTLPVKREAISRCHKPSFGTEGSRALGPAKGIRSRASHRYRRSLAQPQRPNVHPHLSPPTYHHCSPRTESSDKVSVSARRIAMPAARQRYDKDMWPLDTRESACAFKRGHICDFPRQAHS